MNKRNIWRESEEDGSHYYYIYNIFYLFMLMDQPDGHFSDFYFKKKTQLK